MRLRILQAGIVALAVAAGFPAAGSAIGGVGIPAQIVDVTKETAIQSHPTTDYGTMASAVDDRVGSTTWRVVKDTGNCCELHLDSSPDGRLFDIGGSFVNYTDDLGVTWKSVRPQNPLVNGEGSMAFAPNGDVLAMTWDAYSGDHFVAYKYNAVSGEWFTLDNPLHEPFYDRPWLTVVPGSFAIGLGADTVPYLSFVQGGTGIKDPLLESNDGLDYEYPSSTTIGTGSPVQAWFPVVTDPMADWDQPIRSAPVTPLGNGRALNGADGTYLFDPSDQTWHQWTLPDGSAPPTFIQVDSAGRIHSLRAASSTTMEYRISADGGRTWRSATFPVAFGSANLPDFKVNKALGISALAVRIDAQDWVYKFDISGDTAKLIRRYRVGLGDNPAGSDVSALTAPRMDFSTVAILPDGRVATSFLDSTTLSHPPGTGALGRITPALAIELDTTLPAYKNDLSPQSITPVQGAKSKLSFTAKVANLGQGSAADAVVRFAVDGTQLGADKTIAGLAGGSTGSVTSDAWSVPKAAGTHTVTVVVDPDGAVPESNESNNTATLTFRTKDGKLVR
jgi:CARDB